jgi:hypothetical protein
VIQGAPSSSTNCTIKPSSQSIHETSVPSSDAPRQRNPVTVEEIEDEDELRAKAKEKMCGTGILEEAEKVPQDQKPPINHFPKRPIPSEPGAGANFLKKLRESRKGAMKLLKGWVARQRQNEVTVFLLQALLTAPFNNAVATLEDLCGPRHYISQISKHNSLEIPLSLQTTDTGRTFSTNCLLDCGVMGCYIDKTFAKSQHLNLDRLSHSILVYNANNTLNDGGPIPYTVTLRMKIHDHEETITFAITNTGRSNIILGHAWLRRHNPLVDWKTNSVIFTRCPRECALPQVWNNGPEMLSCADDDDIENEEDGFQRVSPNTGGSDGSDKISVMYGDERDGEWKDLEEGDRLFVMPEDVEMIRAYATISQRLAEENECKKAKVAKASVPDCFIKDFAPVFEKAAFDTLPPKRKWDHAIELKEGGEPFTSKIYPLSLDKQHQLDEFLDEHLKSGRIQPSKGPLASAFFFVKKKDRSLRPVQDYC